jgi:hypothetical protein
MDGGISHGDGLRQGSVTRTTDRNMSYRRHPASCSWHSLLALPLFVFAVLLLLLHFLSPEGVGAQAPQLRGAVLGTSGLPYDHETMAPSYRARPLLGSIQIDGVLDDVAWQAAPPFTRSLP